VNDLINAILADFGLPAADTGGADGSLAGYIVADPGTARAALEPICDLYALAAREDAGRLVFSTEARTDAVVEPAALAVGDDAPVIERVRDPDSVLPTEAHLDFRDLMKDHQAATAEAYRAGAATDAKTFISFPGAMAPGAAQGLLADWLRRKWDGRERVTFSVPMTEMAIRPGAVVRLAEADDEYLVTEVEDGLKRTVQARRIRRLPPTPWEPDEPGKATGIVIGASKPLALFLDLPMTPGAETPHQQFRLAVRAKPWRSQVVLVSPEETGFEQRTTVTRRAIVGKLLEDLGGGFEGRIDRASSVRVELFDGELASVTALQMLNGANAAAIRSSSGAWEIIQFAEAAEVAASVWRLSSLLRGQLGTNDAMAAGATAGADFVLLDEAVQPAGLLASEAGLRLNWRVGPAGFDISDEHFAMQAETGGVRSRLPLSPVHIGGRLDASGDLAISWIRRGRIDADSWLSEEIPLGEETEAYRIAVLSEERGTVRMVTVSAPSWTYTHQQMAADFGAIPERITVTVSQLGALGEGVPATATVPIR